MNRFANQIILVTGASSGIGKATAQRIASEGGQVILVARDEARIAEVLASLPGEGHLSLVCDLTDESLVAAKLKELKASGVVLSGMAHCAGIHWLKPLQLTDTSALRSMLASHVESSLTLVRGLINARLGNPTGLGIVLLSSVAALRGSALSTAYAAAKGALISAARAMAVELSNRKIRVNVVAPGVVKTPQAEAWLGKLTPEQAQAVEASHPLGVCEASDVAAAITFLLSNDAVKITGVTLPVDGGLNAK